MPTLKHRESFPPTSVPTKATKRRDRLQTAQPSFARLPRRKFPDSFEFAPPIFSGPHERPPWTFGPQFVHCQADGPIKRTSFKTPQGSILKPVKMLVGGDGHFFEEIGTLPTNYMDPKTWNVKICGRADYELERLEGGMSRSLFELIELGYSPRIPLCAEHDVAKQPMKHPDLVIMEEKLEGKGGEAQDVEELARQGREEELGKAIELDGWPSKEEAEAEDEEMLCSLFAGLQRANREQRQGAAQAPAAPAAPVAPAAAAPAAAPARQPSPTTTTTTTASQTGPRASAFSQSPGTSSSSTSRMRQAAGKLTSQPAMQPSPSPTTTVKADPSASGASQSLGPSSSAPARKIAPRPTPRAAAPATTIKGGPSPSGASQSPASSFLSAPTRMQATQPTPAATPAVTPAATPTTRPAAAPAATPRRTPIVQPAGVDCREWLMKCIWFGKDRFRSPEGNGDCGYKVLEWAVGMKPDDIRFLFYDWVVNELRKFWPGVRDEVIDQLKRSIFVGGIRGNKGVAEGVTLPRAIWLNRGHLGFLAQIFGRLICAYDLEDADGAATYAPVEGGYIEAEPICLAISHDPGHWVEVQRKEFPLPPLDYSCWGRQRERFMGNATHARVLAKWNFYVRQRRIVESPA